MGPASIVIAELGTTRRTVVPIGGFLLHLVIADWTGEGHHRRQHSLKYSMCVAKSWQRVMAARAAARSMPRTGLKYVRIVPSRAITPSVLEVGSNLTTSPRLREHCSTPIGLSG